jgi:CDGSH iron-sulfur domain-containing protein 3
MLKRIFTTLKVIEERKSFKIYKIPNRVHKQQFLKTDEWKKNPEPITVAKRPFILENPKLGSKRYYWCSCGLSKKQPFCDSSHMRTSFKPVDFIIQENTNQVALCLCKKTSKAPYCDYKACGCTQETQ